MTGNLTRRFIRDRGGTTSIIFGLSLIPIIFLVGLGLDFSAAAQKQTQLNTAADAAALAAVAPGAMTQTAAQAQATATNIFMAQASLVPNLSYSAPTVTVVQNGMTRTVTVSYTAYSINSFPNVFALLTKTAEDKWTLNGSSTSTSTTSPNINFYLLLDNSPSMAIAATTAGINTMVANTQAQGGCAFACHESNPGQESPPLGNPNGEDNYTLAQNLGVVTRIQNMATATSQLMTTATDVMTANNATCPNGPGCYQMAIFTFNLAGNNASSCNNTSIQVIYAPNCAASSNLSAAQTAAGNINVVEVCKNSWLTCSNNNNDTDTDFETAMSAINSIMPTPGTGTAGNPPQEVLFLVTDGVDDEINSSSCSQPLDSGNRCQQPFNTAWCTTVKNNGIRIAVLYTEYLPLPTNAWYNQWINPFQSSISSNMQSCASPGLYKMVTTDDDIAAAMETLFQIAISSARLAQ